MQGVVASFAVKPVGSRAAPANKAVAVRAAAERIRPGAAIERVRARQAVNLVVAVPAEEQRVVSAAAPYGVVEIEIVRPYRR